MSTLDLDAPWPRGRAESEEPQVYLEDEPPVPREEPPVGRTNIAAALTVSVRSG